MTQGQVEWRDRIATIADGWMFADVDGAFPARVIIPFENPDYFDWDRYCARLDEVHRHRAIAIGRYRGETVGILKSKFGSAATCFATHLLANRDVTRIVGIGYCGGIHPDFDSGRIVASTSVSRICCASRRYLPVQSDIEASPALMHAATVWAMREGINLARTRTISTDDILLESSVQMRTLHDSGIHAIDMECGALYALSRHFGIDALALMVVSDNPLANAKADYAKVEPAMSTAIDMGLSILVA
jgi:purine-nucleoside phosphorylase